MFRTDRIIEISTRTKRLPILNLWIDIHPVDHKYFVGDGMCMDGKRLPGSDADQRSFFARQAPEHAFFYPFRYRLPRQL